MRKGRLAVPQRKSGQQVVEGVGVRVLGTKTQGFAATEDISPHAVSAAAAEAARQGKQDENVQRALPMGSPRLHWVTPDDPFDGVASSGKSTVVHRAVEAAFSLDSRVQQVAVAYHGQRRRVAVATSAGQLGATASSGLALRVAVTLATEAGPISAYAMGGAAGGFDDFFMHQPEHLAREAVERAGRLTEARPLAAATMPVVLAAGWCGVWLHEAVGHLLEADTVASGGSPFAGCLGQANAAPNITLVDDATYEGGRGTYAFDDEGTPARRTTLIDAGRLQAYLTDRRTAEALGMATTGNARRQDYRHAPLPRMTNLVLLPGDASREALIADVDEGLYVTAVGQGMVQPGGRFAFEVLEGYHIEGGRLGRPVTGVRLVGSGPEVLRAIKGVGRDLEIDTGRGLCKKGGQVVPVSVGTPTVLVHSLRVEPL